MKPCRRIGIDITKRCNWKCKTCFYHHEPDFNENFNYPLPDLKAKITEARKGGCDAVVVVGKGEPMLYPDLFHLASWIKYQGMSFSIITNGSGNLEKYSDLWEGNLINHFHVSVHGVDETLNRIAGVSNAAERQESFLHWMVCNDIPWRSNTTLQLENYKFLPGITQYILDHNCRHVVLLGFLPHYGWKDRLREVAVSPADLRSYVQKAASKVLKAGQYLTIRYHPMCHLDPEFWPYVVNARYVVYDPFEWNYNRVWPNANSSAFLVNALGIGDSVAIKGEPCARCALQVHCGGWNRTYAAEFDGADLKPVTREMVHSCYPGVDIETPGALHDLNPVNDFPGWL